MLIRIRELLQTASLVLVEGAPRSGKTTLAGQLVRSGRDTLFLDARSREASNILMDPEFCFGAFGFADAARRPGIAFGTRVIVVDNADEETVSRIARSLEGRGREGALDSPPRFVLIGTGLGPSRPTDTGSTIARLTLDPLSLFELGRATLHRHWHRGGFPEAVNADTDEEAFAWLWRYADSLAGERFAQAGLPWAPDRTRRLLSMLAEAQASPLNESAIARSLGVSRPTVSRSVTALRQCGLVRFLPALPAISGKRVIKAATFYLRDSGLLHALLGITGIESLLGSARLAASWEGYVVEEVLRLLPEGIEAAQYRTQDGAGLELVFLKEGSPLAGAAIRWARSGAPGRGAFIAAADVRASRNWLVLPETEERELAGGFRTLGIARFLELVAELPALPQVSDLAEP